VGWVVNWAGEPAGLVWYYGHGRRIALLRESGRNGQRILGQNLRTTKEKKFGLKNLVWLRKKFGLENLVGPDAVEK
jgi:hypothetical protein